MIAICPSGRSSLTSVLSELAETSLSQIIDDLNKYTPPIGYDDDVHVILPKFKIITAFNLNYILQVMGIYDVFREADADLSDISPNALYISNAVHRVEIEVSEEGTEASSATVVEAQNKIEPAIFRANRPFAFLVYDKETKSILFAGIYIRPIYQ